MKSINLIILAMSMLTTTAYAERIDEASGNTFIVGSPISVKPGTQNKSCNKRIFIKRNSGTLVTGLTATQIVPYSTLEYSYDSTTGKTTVKNVALARSLTATAVPGVYSLCFWPTSFSWKASAHYEIKALVRPNTSDNGVFTDLVSVSAS